MVVGRAGKVHRDPVKTVMSFSGDAIGFSTALRNRILSPYGHHFVESFAQELIGVRKRNPLSYVIDNVRGDKRNGEETALWFVNYLPANYLRAYAQNDNPLIYAIRAGWKNLIHAILDKEPSLAKDRRVLRDFLITMSTDEHLFSRIWRSCGPEKPWDLLEGHEKLKRVAEAVEKNLSPFYLETQSFKFRPDVL